jgi:hypothetical protein
LSPFTAVAAGNGFRIAEPAPMRSGFVIFRRDTFARAGAALMLHANPSLTPNMVKALRSSTSAQMNRLRQQKRVR